MKNKKTETLSCRSVILTFSRSGFNLASLSRVSPLTADNINQPQSRATLIQCFIDVILSLESQLSLPQISNDATLGNHYDGHCNCHQAANCKPSILTTLVLQVIRLSNLNLRYLTIVNPLQMTGHVHCACTLIWRIPLFLPQTYALDWDCIFLVFLKKMNINISR